MKKVLFIAIIILGLSSCMADYTPIGEVKMDVMEQKFTQDTTSFDSYVKIIDNTYYFYSMDEKELYAKVPVKVLMAETGVDSFFLGALLGIMLALICFSIQNMLD